MGRGDLSDAEWELIGPLLPSERGRWARLAGDNRRFLNGMLHVLRIGQQLRIATRYHKTVLSDERFLNLAAARLWLKTFVNTA